MKFKSTFFLVILLVAGAAAVYLLDYKPDEERKVEEFLEKKFIPLEADSINEIDLITDSTVGIRHRQSSRDSRHRAGQLFLGLDLPGLHRCDSGI